MDIQQFNRASDLQNQLSIHRSMISECEKLIEDINERVQLNFFINLSSARAAVVVNDAGLALETAHKILEMQKVLVARLESEFEGL